jgi:hypothetical protein
VEHVWNLSQDALLYVGLGILATGQRESMDPKGGRQINLVVLGCADSVSSGGEVTIIDVFSRCDKILFVYGCTAWNYGGRTANTFVE